MKRKSTEPTMIDASSLATKPPKNGSKRLPRPPLKADSRSDSSRILLRRSARDPRSETALRRQKISREQLALVPDVSSILKDIFKSPHKAIPNLRFSNDAVIVQFLEAYDSIPAGDVPYLPFEAIILKSKVNAAEFLGAMLFCFKNVQAQKSALLAMAEHPNVLKKRIEFAKEKGGTRDRDALDTAVGFLPSPKGTSLTFNLGQPPSSPKEPEALSEDADVNDVFPIITTKQHDWQDRRNKLLKEKN